MDNLTFLFKKQRLLQDTLKNNINIQEYRSIMILASIDELMEMLRETPWKPWKKQQTFNKERFKEEYIDLIHFVINLGLAAGLSSNELIKRYKIKNKINFKRQKNGY